MSEELEEEHQYNPTDEIGFEEEPDDWDEEARSHVLDAFAQKAGYGPHPGKIAHEINYGKMRAVEDDEEADMDPSGFENREIQQFFSGTRLDIS
jgi:hypothetical protein